MPGSTTTQTTSTIAPTNALNLPKRIKLIVRTPPERILHDEIVADKSRQHPWFWDPEGDFVFTGADSDIWFRVKWEDTFHGRSRYMSTLARHSARDKLAQTLDGSFHEWEILLGLFCREEARMQPTLRECIAAFTIGTQFQFPSVRMWAQARLRKHYFQDPATVRATVLYRPEDNSQFPGELDDYSEIFRVPSDMELDPQITVLALYAAMLKDADLETRFQRQFPKETWMIQYARGHFSSLYECTRAIVLTAPYSIFHAEGEKACLHALEDFVPEQPEDDIAHALYELLYSAERPTCCAACTEMAMGSIQTAYEYSFDYLASYFHYWMPDLERGWVFDPATARLYAEGDISL